MCASPKAARRTPKSSRRPRTSRKGISRLRMMSHSTIRPPGARTRAHSARRALTIAHQMGGFEDPGHVEAGVGQSGLGAVTLLEVGGAPAAAGLGAAAGAVELAFGGERSRRLDAVDACGDAEDTGVPCCRQLAGLMAGAASDVEHAVACVDVRPLEHQLGQGRRRLGERRLRRGEVPVVELLTHDEAPGTVDVVVVCRRLVRPCALHCSRGPFLRARGQTIIGPGGHVSAVAGSG